MNIKTPIISIAVAGGMAISSMASAGESVTHQNIAAVYAPDTRARASSTGGAADAVSILDGIAKTWRDPSSASVSNAEAAAGSVARAKTLASKSRDASDNTIAERSLRRVFNAYAAG